MMRFSQMVSQRSCTRDFGEPAEKYTAVYAKTRR